MRVISRPLSKTAKRASSNGIDQTLQAIGLAGRKKDDPCVGTRNGAPGSWPRA